MKKYKNILAKSIYSALYFLDEKFNKVNRYGYETAPYCGHYYSGHRGYFTNSSYHEGIGGCSATLLFGLISVYKHSEENNWQLWIKRKH